MDPIKLGKAEIISLDFKTKVIGLLIHHSFGENERYSPEANKEFGEQKKKAVKYLIMEGFIPVEQVRHWQCLIRGMYHSTDLNS